MISGRRPAAWADGDLQLALWCCYELHYRGFEDVDEDWQWHPAVTAFRGALERRWVAALRGLTSESGTGPADELPGALRDLIRRDGAVKAALVEIQADEYGGRAERMHAELFRTTMRWLGLDDGYGHYVPAVPAVTLAAADIQFGAACCLAVDDALARHLLSRWEAGQSSLLTLAGPGAA